MGRTLRDIGRALGADARVAMIEVMFDGAGHGAGELALAAGVAPSTASEHLAVLVTSGLVRCNTVGRRREYVLRDAQIADALELLGVGGVMPALGSLRASREQRRVRQARTCYDHLAGRLGVTMARHAVAAGWVAPTMDSVSDVGRVAYARIFAVDVSKPSRRILVRSCDDWTERSPHLAGRLGAAITQTFFDRDWIERRPGSRAVRLTDDGAHALIDIGIEW